MKILVISDTHGLLRPELIDLLGNCQHVIHAGDLGTRDVLDRLARLGPGLTAVRGNVDSGVLAMALPETAMIELGGKTFYVLHDLARLDLDPRAAGIDVVVHGHTHRATIERKRGVVYLNPGSIGPKRQRQPVTYAEVMIEGAGLEWAIHEIEETAGG